MENWNNMIHSIVKNNLKRILLIDNEDVGSAIYEAKLMAIRVGFEETSQVLISTAVSELSTNIIRYAGSGEIILKTVHETGKTGIEIQAIDNGPGIDNIEKAMQDHFTTTPDSLGLGLSSVKRIMDTFKIDSIQGKGTRIIARKWKSNQKVNEIDYFFSARTLQGEEECGDLGIIEVNGNMCFLGVIDAVGHGMIAHEIAVTAEKYLMQNIKSDLVNLIKGLHEHLKQTRGVVLALCRLNIDTGDLVFSGIGNISAKILGPRHIHLNTQDGIVGYMMTTPKEQRFKLYPGDILVMTSDGVRENFDLIECAELLKSSAEVITRGILERYGKKNDDASCLTLKLLL